MAENSTTGSSSKGGGVYRGAVTISDNSTIQGNSTAGDSSAAGGVFASNGGSVYDSIIRENVTSCGYSDGGGAFSLGSVLALIRSALVDNAASGKGSVGSGANGIQLTLIDAPTFGNMALGDGGRESGRADRLSGGGGSDTLKGNGGVDVFQFRTSDRNDTISNFRQSQDKSEIQNGARSFEALTIEQDGRDALISFSAGLVRVMTDNAAAFDESVFVF